MKYTIENGNKEFLQYDITLGDKPYKWSIQEHATKISVEMMKIVMPILVANKEDTQKFKFNEVV